MVHRPFGAKYNCPASKFPSVVHMVGRTVRGRPIGSVEAWFLVWYPSFRSKVNGLKELKLTRESERSIEKWTIFDSNKTVIQIDLDDCQ